MKSPKHAGKTRRREAKALKRIKREERKRQPTAATERFWRHYLAR